MGIVHRLWVIQWNTTNFIKRIKCFFVGHKEHSGDEMNYEPPYCSRCWMDWPQDAVTWLELRERLEEWWEYRMEDLWFSRMKK